MITVLNANGQSVAHFVNNVSEGVPYFEPTLTENIETLVSTFSFFVPMDCDESQYLEGLNKVLFKDKDGDLRQFNIIRTEEIFQETNSTIFVECEDFSISEMNDTVVYPFNGLNMSDALSKAVKNTGWSVEYAADTWQEGDEPFVLADYTNMREVFGNLQKAYDIDFKFTAERTAFNQTRRIVKVYKSRGVQTGRYFTYNRDVLGITREVQYDAIKTAILPFYVNNNDEVKNLTGFAPVNPIEGFIKDLESPLVVHSQAHSDYDEPFFYKAMPFKASAKEPELAYRQAVDELLNHIAPTYTYTVNVILLNRVAGWEGETLNLGDTVWIKERVGSREIGLEARVIEYVYHEDDPSLDEVTFTNFREIDTYDTSDIAGIRDALNDLSGRVDSNSSIILSVNQQIAGIVEGQEGIIETLGTKNSVSIGATPKPNPIDGDIWFSTRLNDKGQIIHEIKTWDAIEEVWKISMDTSKAFEAEDAANAAQQDAEESLEKANQAIEDAEDALVLGQTNSSKITLLEDAVNLRVEKDDVINQINISTEGIIIDGAKVQITGSTFIANAVIKDAMIDSLSATKLTAGVIDASIINVTNINASNLVAGTIQGIDITGTTITGSEFINTWNVTSGSIRDEGESKIKSREIYVDNNTYITENGVETLRGNDHVQISGGVSNVTKSYNPQTGLVESQKTAQLLGGFLNVSSNYSDTSRNASTTIQDNGIVVNGKKQFSVFYGNSPNQNNITSGTLLRIGPFMGTDFNTSVKEHNDTIWFNPNRDVLQIKEAGTYKFDINLRHQGNASSDQSRYIYTHIVMSSIVGDLTTKGESGYIHAVGSYGGTGSLNFRFIGMGSFVLDVPKDYFIAFRLAAEASKYSFITNVPSLQITKVFI